MATLHAAAAHPQTTELATGKASAVLPPLAQASWRKLAKQGRRLHNELEGHDDHWHRTRITAKRARYTVEACVPVFGGPAKKFAKQLEYVTELLGEHQDAAIAAELVQQLGQKARGRAGAVRTRRPVRAAAQPGRRHPPRVRRRPGRGWPTRVAQLDGGQAMSRTPIVAAGCLVTRTGPDGTEVLLVHRPRYDDWSLPKGKADAGEHLTSTAVREVLEETGLVVALRRPLPMHTVQGRRRPQGGPLLAGCRRRGRTSSYPTTRSTRSAGCRSTRPPPRSPGPMTRCSSSSPTTHRGRPSWSFGTATRSNASTGPATTSTGRWTPSEWRRPTTWSGGSRLTASSGSTPRRPAAARTPCAPTPWPPASPLASEPSLTEDGFESAPGRRWTEPGACSPTPGAPRSQPSSADIGRTCRCSSTTWSSSALALLRPIPGITRCPTRCRRRP